MQGSLKARYRATLAGFATYTGAALLLVVLGDMLYRLKRVEGEDGFVSYRRWAGGWGRCRHGVGRVGCMHAVVHRRQRARRVGVPAASRGCRSVAAPGGLPDVLPPPLPPAAPRPAAHGQAEADAVPAAPRQPLRPVEWAFLASVALAAAGTAIALGGLASTQALCNQGGQQGNFMVSGGGWWLQECLAVWTGTSLQYVLLSHSGIAPSFP